MDGTKGHTSNSKSQSQLSNPYKPHVQINQNEPIIVPPISSSCNNNSIDTNANAYAGDQRDPCSNSYARSPPSNVVDAHQLQSEIAGDMNLKEEVQQPRYKLTGVYDSFYRKDISIWRLDGNYKIFAIMYQPKSLLGIMGFSLFLMGLLVILLLIIDTVYTVPARFVIKGLLER